MTIMIASPSRSESQSTTQSPVKATPSPSRPVPSPSPAKRKFQRLRVRSLSRSRSNTKANEPVEEEEDVSQFASPMTRRRNNSAGNLYAVEPFGSAQRPSISRASRSTFNLIQDAQRNTMRHLSKSWDSLTRMADGRNCQVILLDGRKIEIVIQPKLLAGDLLDIVCSHYNLKEKEYFGLAYLDETNSFNWLQLEKKVLEHDYLVATPKKHKFIVLFFLVKFFVESVTHLRDAVTVELFYLQAKTLVVQGVIQTEQETAFELAAYVLQACYGDFTDVEAASEHIKKHQLLAAKIIKEAASLAYCEERIVDYYRKLKGLPRGNAIVNYMTIIESLSTYGVHYYEVTDKTGGKFLLGISHRGLGQYQTHDKRIPEKVFLWKDLGNLFFRDKKFSAEVLEARRVVHALSSVNLYEDAIDEPSDQCDDLSNAISDPTTQVSVSRRTFAPGQLTVHVWFAATPALARTIWTMAISQHQYYLERKKNQNNVDQRTPAEIALELTNVTSLYSVSDTFRPRSGSVCSSYSYKIVRDGSLTSGFASDDSISQMSEMEKKDMFNTAKTRRDALTEKLAERLAKLKEICLREAEITGELPPETPLKEGEAPPPVRRRMGTSFELSATRMESDIPLSVDEKFLADLELQYELQMNITKAAEKLVNDAGGKTIKKQRKSAYRREHAKLKETEKKLKELRIALDRDPRNGSLDSRDMQISHSSSLSSGLGDSSSLQSFNRPPHSPALSLRSSTSRSSVSIPEAISTPPSRSHSNGNFRPPGASAPYVPSSVYQTRTAYRHQQYPTLSPVAIVKIDSPPPPSVLDRKESSGGARHEPRVINHKIIVEVPPRIASTTTLKVTAPPARASSWDRSRVRQMEPTPYKADDEPDSKYSTLDPRKPRPTNRARGWQETTIDYHQRIPTPQIVRIPANLPHSPSPVCFTAEVTKPYELADYYKYSNRVRKLSRATPDEPDQRTEASGSPSNRTSASPNSGTLYNAHTYPVSPAPVVNGFRMIRELQMARTGSPSDGSSSSTRSDRTVSPKLQTATAQIHLPARPLQCVSALPRATREAQIAWNDDGVPKTPTIV